MARSTASIRQSYAFFASTLDLRAPQIWGYFFSVRGVSETHWLADALQLHGLRFVSADVRRCRVDCTFEAIERHSPASLQLRLSVLELAAAQVPTAALESFSVCARKLGLARDLRRGGRRWPSRIGLNLRLKRELQRAINQRLQQQEEKMTRLRA